MKVVGTFNPKQLYYRQKAAKQTSEFAAMLEFNLDKKPGEQDVTALFASNNGDLERLYEQTTGKRLSDKTENKTIVVSFYSLKAVGGRRTGEVSGDADSVFEKWIIPARRISSNQNMKCAVR